MGLGILPSGLSPGGSRSRPGRGGLRSRLGLGDPGLLYAHATLEALYPSQQAVGRGIGVGCRGPDERELEQQAVIGDVAHVRQAAADEVECPQESSGGKPASLLVELRNVLGVNL